MMKKKLKITTRVFIIPLIMAISQLQADTFRDFTEQENRLDKPVDQPAGALGLGQDATFREITERANRLDNLQGYNFNFKGESPFSIRFLGYVKAESIFDSRQVVGVREDQVLLYPEPKKPDVNGKDINACGQFNEFAIETRVAADIHGPNVACLESRAYIEGDFFGHLDELPDVIHQAGLVGANENINTFRMRHAYLELAGEHFRFLAGQTWIPLYFPVVSPATISFSAGVPIDPFGRSPQLRLGYYDDIVDVFGAMLGTVDAFDDGPLGASTRYFRDAIVPEFHLQLRYKFDKEDANYIGVGANYRRIVPRLVTNNDFVTREAVNSAAAIVYAKATYEPFEIYFKTAWVQKAEFYAMIGGYAVDCVDPITDIRTYTPFNTVGVWTEIIYKDACIEPALFLGYVTNLGASKPIIKSIRKNDGTFEGTIYGLGTDIRSVVHFTPRVRWYLTPFVAAAEIEYSRATYGTPNEKGKPINTCPVSNCRFLLAFYYVF